MIPAMLGHVYALIGFALILLAAAYIWWRRRNEKFWWTDFTYAFPAFGKIDRLSRGSRADRSADDQGLTPAENQLLHDYSVHLGATDPSAFARARQFLKLTGQDNRRPTPLIMLPLLFVLLLAEALGFSFLLAPFIAAEITPYQAEIIGIIVAFVLATIAAGLTHAAGAQWYEGSLYRKMRAAARDHGVRMFEQQITPADDQDKDNAAKYPTRFGNRVFATEYDKPGVSVILAAMIYIVAIAAVSTGVRYENLHLLLSEQSALQVSPGGSGGGNPFANAGNSDASGLPAAVTENARSAQRQILADENGERLMRGLAGISGLGVIFVFTQIFSTYMGLRYGHLNAKRVVDAYNLTGGYLDYPEYERHELTPKISVVEARLRTLRRKLYDDHGRASGTSSITFRQWLARQETVRKTSSAVDHAGQTSVPNHQAPVHQENPDAARIWQFAREVLDLPQEQRKDRLVALKSQLRPIEMNALRVALDEEKRRRAEQQRRQSSSSEPWMEDI